MQAQSELAAVEAANELPLLQERLQTLDCEVANLHVQHAARSATAVQSRNAPQDESSLKVHGDSKCIGIPRHMLPSQHACALLSPSPNNAERLSCAGRAGGCCKEARRHPLRRVAQ